MLCQPINNGVTADEIACKLNISVRAVQKRFKSRFDIIVKQESKGGRPFYVYDPLKAYAEYGCRMRTDGELERLSVYPMLPNMNNEEIELKPTRKARNDKHILRRKDINETQLEELKEIIKHNYLNQALKNNLYRIVFDTLKSYFPDKNQAEIEDLHQYIYKRYLTIKNASALGAWWSENWQGLWESKWKVNQMNAKNPMNTWGLFEIFENAGWTGKGFGANLFWVIDGTQFDAWVRVWDEEKQKEVVRTVNMLVIMDGITGMPLWARPLQNGESISAAASTVMECISIYGAPRFGFILDNGKAFRSERFKSFLRAVCPTGDFTVNELKALKTIFPKSEAPIYYPLAKMPRYVFKAKLERLFEELNKYPALVCPRSYQNGTESRLISLELGTTPVIAQKSAPDFFAIFYGFAKHMLTEFAERSNLGVSRYFRQKGLLSVRSPLAAFEYYGGDVTPALKVLETGELPCNAALDRPELTYYLAEESDIKHIKSDALGRISLTLNHERIDLQCEALDYTYLNSKIAILPKKVNGEWSAQLFFERPGHAHPKTPNTGDVYYIGEARDSVIRSIDDIASKRALRAKNQRAQQKTIKSAMIPKIELAEYELIENEQTRPALPYESNHEFKKVEVKTLKDSNIEIEITEDDKCWKF